MLLNALAAVQPSSGKLYVEDVFSTYLYTGNGSTQTITNGIDLAGKGGLVWIKARSGSQATAWHMMADTARGTGKGLSSNSTGQEFTNATFLTSFNSNGFNPGTETSSNGSGTNFASWTFRKAPKFFDVVTYTGNGANRTIAHSLGVAPGCIIVKRTDTSSNWAVYHRGQTSASFYTKLNLTDAQASDSTVWNGTAPTDTAFSVGSSALTNASGGTYVAYLFAHDATADGIIQCGSYTGNGSVTGPVVNLGWEPQWLMIKNASGTGEWKLFDNMRGMPVKNNQSAFVLQANDATSEENFGYLDPSSTGFQITTNATQVNTSGSTYIYIAIRRGPMKTPTVGTSVFNPSTSAGTAGTVITTGFPVDMQLIAGRTIASNKLAQDRLRGVSSTTTESAALLYTNLTNAENVAGGARAWDNTGFQLALSGWAGSSASYWSFRRAPGFFDVVCYTGTGAAFRNINHNLGVAPELLIIKRRNAIADWPVAFNFTGTGHSSSWLNGAVAADTYTYVTYGENAPTASTFSVGDASYQNGSGGTYVAYLFASCPGVSKVGSYTGNGSSQTINCGFSNGARFFLVKRTDSTGDWWVYDSARGIVAAADPALRLNSTAAETSADAVDTNSTGIIVNQETTCNINVNGATYIYLAIA